MGRTFWVIAGAAAFVLIALLASGDSGEVMGLETGLFATLSITTLWGAFLASSLLGTRTNWGMAAVQLSIWALIILTLMALYAFRYELQDIGHRFTGGLLPGSPISATYGEGRKEVTIIRSSNGHFEVDADINSKNIRFLIDTGASSIVLTHADAERAGIAVENLNYNIPVMTANGISRAALSYITSLRVAEITRRNLRITIAQPGRLGQSLLGQQFMESLSSYERRGDRLTLRD